MSISPTGQKRPADILGCTALVGKISTGEANKIPAKRIRSAGGRAKAETLSENERSKIATAPAEARWSVL